MDVYVYMKQCIRRFHPSNIETLKYLYSAKIDMHEDWIHQSKLQFLLYPRLKEKRLWVKLRLIFLLWIKNSRENMLTGTCFYQGNYMKELASELRWLIWFFHYTFSHKIVTEICNSNNFQSLYTAKSFLNWKQQTNVYVICIQQQYLSANTFK